MKTRIELDEKDIANACAAYLHDKKGVQVDKVKLEISVVPDDRGMSDHRSVKAIAEVQQ